MERNASFSNTLAFGIGVWMGESAADMFMVAVALAVSAVVNGVSAWKTPWSRERYWCTP